LVRGIKDIKIVLSEERPRDGWFDLSLRHLREGVVRFYRVNDLLTGKWLFKVCRDREFGKAIVKAVKCPAGMLYSQLEGSTMVFQRDGEGFLYDIISSTYVDGDGRVRRRAAAAREEVSAVVKERFEIRSYEEATGKAIPGKKLVTLTREENEKEMIALFLLERAWPLLPSQPGLGLEVVDVLGLVRELERAKVEDVYGLAQERFGVERSVTEEFLGLLEARGRIAHPEPGYVKVV
jgi:hypothetical protein